jgi:hypothetical protein
LRVCDDCNVKCLRIDRKTGFAPKKLMPIITPDIQKIQAKRLRELGITPLLVGKKYYVLTRYQRRSRIPAGVAVEVNETVVEEGKKNEERESDTFDNSEVGEGYIIIPNKDEKKKMYVTDWRLEAISAQHGGAKTKSPSSS